jgi:heat shock protein HtpX
MNSVKTALLLGLLSGLMLAVGAMLGGQNGLMIGLALAVATNFFSYFFSERLSLMAYSAEPITPEDHPDVYARVYPLVQNLTQRMGLPMPRLWLIPSPSPNAFATGRNPRHASVAFTEGVLYLMNDRELEGVVAHELGHVLHRDILISSVAATLATALTQLVYIRMWFGGSREEEEDGGGWGALLMVILAPLAAGLIQMSISRTRELSADATSVKYTGSPDGLIAALRKLEQGSERVPLNATPATAHLFIMKPFTSGWWGSLFSTHPSTEERIARLEALRVV